MEATHSTAINELRTTIGQLRDVIGELGINAATQTEALKGIKEVFTREFTTLRDEQQQIGRSQEATKAKIDENDKTQVARDELFAEKLNNRFKEVEGRVGTLETSKAQTAGFWDGSKWVIGLIAAALGGVMVYALQHVHIG